MLKKAMDYLRQVLGEGAYARYCEHLRRTGRAGEIPTAKQFYIDSLEKRYSGVSRCC